MLNLAARYVRRDPAALRRAVGLLDAQLVILVREALEADKAALEAATHVGQTPPDAPPGYAHTRASYEIQFFSDRAGRIVNTAPQFEYQIRDTPPHGPVDAHALHFFDGGTGIFATHVRGTEANAALVAALAHQAQTVEGVIQRRTPTLLRALGGA